MTVLAVALVMLCLGSVSAVDENDLNSTLETVNDNSQIENIVIDEINEANTDDTYESTVSVSNEKESKDLLKASDENDKLGVNNIQTVEVSSGPYSVGDSIYVKVSGYMTYARDPVYIQVDGSNYAETTSSKATDSAGVPISFSTPGTYEIKFFAYGWYDDYVSTNSVTVTVNSATEETETSISIEPTTVAPNSQITITPTVKVKGTENSVTSGTVEFFYGDGTSMGSLDLSTGTSFDYTSGFANEGTYQIYAVYQSNDAYDESTSSKIPVLVSSDTSKTPVTVTVTLSESGVAPGETLTATVNVKNSAGEDVSGTVNLRDGNDEIIASDVVIGNPYTITAPTTAGTYYVYAEYLGDDDLAYAAGNSSKSSYKVKQKFDIVLTVEGGDNYNISSSSTYSSISVSFAIDCGSYTPTKMDIYVGTDLNNLNKLEFEGTTDTISFNSDDKGLNYVYVKYEEDEDYLESQSNTVTVGVYYPRTVSLSLNPKIGVENTVVSVTPSVTYNSASVSGTLKLYSDSDRKNLIAVVETGDGANFDYTVPDYTGSYSSTSKSIYYSFEGHDNENYYIYTESSYSYSTSFTILNENSMTITAKDSADGQAQSESIEINEGESVIFAVTNLDYKYSYSKTTVNLFVEGKDGSIATFPTSGYYGTALEELTFNFDSVNYPAGEYVVYAVYDGYESNYDHYAPATSNKITVKIKSSAKDTTISLTPAGDFDIEQGDSEEFTPSVLADGESVTAGTITYYDNDSPIDGYTDVSVDTKFNAASLSVGTHTIKVKYNGADGYNPSDYSDEVNIEVSAPTKAGVTVTSSTYPTHAVATVTGKSAQTYTLTITETGATFDVTIGDSETQASQDLGLLDAGTYHVTIAGEDASATFTVFQATPSITVTAEGNNTSISEAHSITVTSDVDGKITVNGESEQYDVGQAITLDDLSSGSNEITVTLTPTDTVNYKNAEKTVNFVIEKQTVATHIVLEMPKGDSFSYGENSMTVIAHVFDDNDNEVSAGTVTFTPGDNYNSASTIAPGEAKTISDLYNNMNNGKYTLTVQYNGGNDDNYIYETSSVTAPYYRVSAVTSIDLKVNGEYETTVYIGDGVTITTAFSSTSTNYDPSEITATLELLVDGKSKKVDGGYMGANANGDTEIIIPEEFSGDIRLTVYYPAENSENSRLNYRYGSATSNEVILHVKAKETPELTVTADDSYVYGNPITLVPTISVNEGTITWYVDEKENATLNYNVNFVIDRLAVGENHNITAVYNAQGAYASTSASKLITVTKATNTVTVTADEVVLPDGAVKVYVTADVAGTYTVKLNDTDNTEITVVVTEANVKASATSDKKLAVGKYKAITDFADKDNYTLTVNPGEFEVKKSSNTAKVTVTSVDYPNEVTVTVESKVAGDYKVDINGTEVTVSLPEGQTTGSATYKFAADSYYANITAIPASDDYESLSENTTFTVSKGTNTAQIIIDTDNYLPGEVNVKVQGGVKGKYVVAIGAETVEVDVAEDNAIGENTIALAAKDGYVATLTLDNSNYTTTAEPVTFNVKKSVNKIEIFVETADYPEEVTIKVNATVAGTYKVSVDEGVPLEITANDTAGVKAQYAAGSHTAKITDYASDDYEAQTADALFTVGKGTNNIAVEVGDVNLPGTVTVKVTADVAGEYTVVLNDTAKTEVIVEAGKTNTVTLPVGKYSANVTWSNPNYNANINNDTFEVKKSDINLEIIVPQVVYGNPVKFTVKTDVAGTYTISIAGKEFTETLEAGSNELTKDIALDVADGYTASASITGLSDYNDKTATYTFNVVQSETAFKANTTKDEYTYGEDTVLLISEIPDDAKGKVTFKYSNGNPAGEIEDISVTKELNIGKLNADSYTITATYEGDGNYKGGERTFSFKVNPKEITVTVNVDNVVYPGEAVIKVTSDIESDFDVDVNGTTYTVTANGEGRSVKLAAGDYYANISYADSNYKVTLNNDTFAVEKGTNNIVVSVTPDPATYAGEITVKVTADVAGKYTVNINGNPVEVNVDDSLTGEGKTTINLNVDEYTTVTSWENANYTASITEATFNVVQATNNVEITITDVNYGGDVTVNVKADKAGTYTVRLDDTHSVDVTVSDDGETGTATEKIDLKVGNYQATTGYDDTNYNTLVTGGAFEVKALTNVVTVKVEDTEYGKALKVTVEADIQGLYVVDIAGNKVNVNVDDTKTGETTENLDLAVDHYTASTDFADKENYTVTINSAEFDITPKENVITVSVTKELTYGNEEITVTVTADVPDIYEVDVAGTIVKVNVTGASNNNSTVLNLPVATGYEAKVAWSNANYTATITNDTFDVTPATNKVTVEVASVELPSEVTVNVTADVAGTYRVYLNDTAYVDVVVTAPNVKVSQSKKLDAGDYNTRVEFNNANYTNDVADASFTVSEKALDATVEIREKNNLDKDSEVTIKFNDEYILTFVYNVVKPEADIVSENITFYYGGNPQFTNTTVVEGANTVIASTIITDSGSITVKAVYQAKLADGSVFTKESNELTVNMEKEQVTPSGIVQIRDKDTQITTTVTINQDDSVTVTVQYYLNKPSDLGLGSESMYLYVNNVKNTTLTTVGDLWTGDIQLTFTETGVYKVYANYKFAPIMSGYGTEYNEVSNELVYDITIGTPVVNTILIESKEVYYGTEANLAVTGTDGEYTVTVNGKTYDVTVAEGTGNVIIDVLAGSETYDVEIVSKSDANLKNTSTLKVNPISPNLSIDATNKEYTYGGLTTVTVGKNTTATGVIKVFDGEVELTDLNDIKFAAGTHTIKAKYAADGNFTEEEVEVEITVNKAVNELVLTVTNETYPDNVTITLSADIPGEYTVNIGTTPVTVTVDETGTGTASVKLNPSNKYTATVNFEDNGNYSANSAEYEFHVDGSTVGLKVTPETATVVIDDSVDLNTSADKAATGKVTYKSDDGWQSTADIGEVVKYTPQTAGTHKVEVIYDDGVYDPQTLTATITVIKKQNNIKVEVTGSTYPENVTVKVTADVEGTYKVDVNGTIYDIVANGEGKSVKLDAGSYYANVTYTDDKYDSITTNATFEVAKGTNNIKIETDDVTLPEKVSVKVTADVAGTYTVKVGDESENVVIDADGGSKTVEFDLTEGKYTPEVISYADNNYDINVQANEFTVSPAANTDVRIRDANFPVNATITVVADDLYQIAVEYNISVPWYAQKYKLDLYANGQLIHSQGADYQTLDGDKYYPLSGLINVTETNDLDLYLNFTYSDSWSGEVVTQSSNVLKYHITINKETVEPSLTVEAASVKDTENATVTVKSNVAGEYIVTVNGTDYTVTVGDSGENSTVINRLVAGEYTVSVAAKDNVSFKNTTTLSVEDTSIPEPDTLTVEAIGAVYPANASVVVKTNKAGDYIVTVNGKDYEVSIDGESTVVLDVLAADTYDVVVKAKDNASFTNKTTVTVDKGVNNINVEVADVTLPEKAIVKVTADVAGTYTVKVGSESVDLVITADGGSNTAEIELAEGKYAPEITGCDNANYTTEITANEFKVFKAETKEVVIKIRDATYTENDTITINSKDNVTITIEYYLETPDTVIPSPHIDGYVNGEHIEGFGVIYENDIVKGKYTQIKLPNQINKTCELDIYVIYNSTELFGSGGYNAESNHIRYFINIEETEPVETVSITVEADSPAADKNATVTVKASKDGDYVVSVNGADYDVKVVEGSAVVAVNNLPAGDYEVTVTSKDDADVKNSTTLTVKPVPEEPVTVEVSVNSPTADKNATVTVKASKDGDYVVNVDGADYPVAVKDGVGSVTLPVLGEGSYPVTVTAKDDSGVKNSTTLTVEPVPEEPVTVEVSVNSPSADENATVTVKASKDGDYIVTVDGKDYTVAVKDGVGSVTIPVLEEGSYDVTVTSKFNASVKNTTSLDVKPVEKISDHNVTAKAEDATEGTTKLIVSVPENATGNVTVKVGDKTYTAPVKDGKATVDLSDLKAGTYKAEVTYSGDDKYDSKSTTANVNVAKKPIKTVVASDMKRGWNSGMDFKATFKDAKGNPLKNTKVKFKVGSKTYTVKTNAKGVAKLNKKLAVGKYVVTSINTKTGERSKNSLTIVKRLIKNKDVTMDYLDGSEFKVQAIGDNGKPVGAGKIVKITVHGVTYKCKTDKDGWAHRSIGLIPAKYTIKATYKGVTTKNKVVVKQVLKSSNVKVKKSAKKLTLKATLKHSNGKAIKGKTVKFKLNGKTYKAKTDAKGVAKVVLKKKVIKKLSAGKKYKLTVSYSKDRIKKTLSVRR